MKRWRPIISAQLNAELDDLGGGEDLGQLAVEVGVDRVVVGGEQVEEPDRHPLLGVEVEPVVADEAGDVLVGDGVVLAGLHARLALAELGTADPQQLEDAPAEQGAGAAGEALVVGGLEQGGAVGEDLQRDRCRVQALAHPTLDDRP